MTNQPEPVDGYTASHQGTAYYRLPDSGYLQVGGPDRSAFLQRQTTNDVRLLSPKTAVLTVLTTPTARLIDVFYLLPEPETIGVLTLPGRGPATARYLSERIFFMDKVTVSDASASLCQIGLCGPDAAQTLIGLGADPAEIQPSGLPAGAPGDAAASLPVGTPGDLVSFSLQGQAITALRLAEPFGLEWRLLAPAAACAALVAALEQLGARPLTAAAYEMVRIERGVPAPGAELTEDYTPLEVCLTSAVSTTKGCFTGQEVIARQLAQDKVTQQMVGLRLSRPAAPGEKVLFRGKAVGVITSATETPTLGPIALAVVRKPHHEPGTALRLGVNDDTAITAVVTPIPFNFTA